MIQELKQNYCFTIILLLMGIVPMQMNAQNVTVKPSTGSMIASVPENISGGSSDYDTYFRRGGFATWRHNQLCLTMTASDAKTLTANGQLANPANNLYGRTSTNEIELGRGATQDTRNCYMNFALPKGYRFTGYEIVFSRNRSDFGNNGYRDNAYTGGTTLFGETDESFAYKSDYTQSVTYNANATIDDGSTTITHEDETGMGNMLYFKLTDNNTGTGRMVITFHSITLWFTPEEDYTPITSQTTIETPVSAVDIPFATGKVDYGSIERRYYNGQYRVSYSSANVVDMSANMVLYEAESVKDGTHFDGTTGKVVEYKAGSIHNYQDYFKLGKENEEQIYFLETPTYVTLPDADETKNPVGFRIVGAELEYQYGTALPASTVTKTHYYITYTSGGTTYYLDETGHFVTGTKTEWALDDNNYVHSGNVYLTYTSSGFISVTYSLSVGSSTSDNKIRMYNNYLYFYTQGILTTTYYYLQGTTNSSTTPTFSTSSSGRASWVTETTTTEIPAFNPAPFKLHVYGKDGTPQQTIEVNSSDDNGTIELTGLNNDAIKFGVEGIGFIKGTLTMQALDPYIDRMSVVCQDQDKTAIRMTQTFTSNDFSVSGGEFYFYLPADCVGDKVKITYEDLWSHYADETYQGGSANHNSRFSFVKSEHYDAFTNDNIYNNVEEAKADMASVKERQIVETVGKAKFKFNNADEMNSTGGTLTEYPFTQANYAAAPNNGEFYKMLYTVSADDQSQTAYVFTTDETRYNIAPTTAVQHRTYAYYEMIVHVQSSTYTPKVEMKRVYDSSCYEENGAAVSKPFYGVIITAPFGTNNEAGFASDFEVEQAIDDVITLGRDSYGNTDVPENTNQILYVDMSQLAGFYVNDQHELTIDEYKNQKLAKNALMFLPKGVTNTYDNFAYMTDGNNFRAANNIILTDKTPFFSPYDIQVPSNNYATYKRLITASTEKAVKYATVMLPFTLNAENGLHTNDTEDGFQFNIRKMTDFDTPTTGSDGYDYYGDGYFNLIDETIAEANKPYMVEVVSQPENSEYSFIAAQKGSAIKATPTVSDNNKISKIEGETVVVGGSSTLTNYGTYSGVTIPKQDYIFYFNRDKYVSSLNLTKYDEVYVQPFRAYYDYEEVSANTSGSRMVRAFNILYDMEKTAPDAIVSDDAGIIDGIGNIQGKDFTITQGKGFLVVSANKDINVSIKGINGMNVLNAKMKAGEQRIVSVPTGVYMVNKTKIGIR